MTEFFKQEQKLKKIASRESQTQAILLRRELEWKLGDKIEAVAGRAEIIGLENRTRLDQAMAEQTRCIDQVEATTEHARAEAAPEPRRSASRAKSKSNFVTATNAWPMSNRERNNGHAAAADDDDEVAIAEREREVIVAINNEAVQLSDLSRKAADATGEALIGLGLTLNKLERDLVDAFSVERRRRARAISKEAARLITFTNREITPVIARQVAADTDYAALRREHDALCSQVASATASLI
jgi:hypothetical protein